MNPTNMAQKREKEETKVKVSEKLPICAPPPTIPTQQPQLLTSRSSVTPDPKISPRNSSATSPEKTEVSLKRPREVTRCFGSGCRKRIGLIGFRCRCGDMFCSEHRYSDRHDCSYDYKAAGREAIEKENPVVKAAKLLKV